MILMKHPMHGLHNAATSEVEAMQKIGWTITTYAEVMAAKYGAQDAVQEQVASPILLGEERPEMGLQEVGQGDAQHEGVAEDVAEEEAQVTKRRGRPPKIKE